MREELGMTSFEPKLILCYPFRSQVEYELVNSFWTVYDGNISPDPTEISEGRFWTIPDIQSALGKDIFTPNFEQEFLKLIVTKEIKAFLK